VSPGSRPLRAGVVINVAIIALGLVGIVALLLGGVLQDEAAVDDAPDLSIGLEPIASGFESPVLLVGAGDGSGARLVVEQRGTIRRLAPDGSVDEAFVLDLRDRVLHHHERGLLGFALHPEHAHNGRAFALYTRTGDGATVISEIESEDGSSRTGDGERVLLTIPARSTLHKGGMLAFDADGMLLAGIGDGSTGNDPAGDAQDPASLLGKLLRLDVDSGFPYGLPTDNGFAGVAGARPEIHALGLRNPWRFSLDPESGHVYIGDVGQGAWEEVDVLVPGARSPSFGWAEMEGPECFHGRDCDPADHIAPAIAYPHVEGEVGHCAVIGGYVYRGAANTLPAGTYLYADHCSGTVWAVPAKQLREGEPSPVVAAVVPDEVGRVRSFGLDDAGELYLLTDGGHALAIHAGDAGDDG
jgi:glucose/arabinose dehydrogenase